MARKKFKQAAGQPALGFGNKPEKLVVTLDTAVLAELRRRHEETGATMAEMVRRAVKFWIAGTKAAAVSAEEHTFRRVNKGRGSGGTA
ncbi:MAG: hypothetical protein KF771_01960 [Burkholderiales bacterium]|nr:hypothetical protein [Burkholderiales bacterium]